MVSESAEERLLALIDALEGLGASFIRSVLTLIAFLPILVKLSSNVTELPLIGSIPYPLVWAAVIWSLALIAVFAPLASWLYARRTTD